MESAGKGDIVQVAVPDLTDKILLITVLEQVERLLKVGNVDVNELHPEFGYM